MVLKISQMRLQSFREKNSISEAQVLLISACLQEDKDLCEGLVKKWENLVDISDLDYSSSRLVPYFLSHLQKLNIFTVHDKRLKIIYKHWWLRSKHISHQLNILLDKFEKANLDVVVIKGSSMKSHYEADELRTMSDIDLLVKIQDYELGSDLLLNANYKVDPLMEGLFKQNRKLYSDFSHSLVFDHSINKTQVDLHWKLGSYVTFDITNSMWTKVIPYKDFKNVYRPQLANEVFMTLIHAVNTNCVDNFNWIIDIYLINKGNDLSFWTEARELAILDQKLDLFDEACKILNSFGIYTPSTGELNKRRRFIVYTPNEIRNIALFQSIKIRSNNLIYLVDRLYPNKGFLFKLWQAAKFSYLNIFYKFTRH